MKVRKPLTGLQAFGMVVLSLVGFAATLLAVFLAGGWLAWERHTFGPRDLRYLVFVRGTLIERVGAIGAEPGTLAYTARGRDGTAPGYLRAQYTSQVAPDVLFANLRERCRLLGLQVKDRERAPAEGARAASCGREADDAYHVHFKVRPASPTEVSMAEEIDDEVYARR